MLTAAVVLLLVTTSAVSASRKLHSLRKIQEVLPPGVRNTSISLQECRHCLKFGFQLEKLLRDAMYRRRQLRDTVNANTVTNGAALRVLIYPYIPDLKGDGLKSLRQFITREFFVQSGIKIQVDGDPATTDLYTLQNLKTYLGAGPSAYDLVEVDTILLGEMVKANLLQPNPNPGIQVNSESFFRFAVDSVKYNGIVYGIPTLVCSNFLATLTSPKGSQEVDLIGNFRGSWTLPGHYLNGYVNKLGASTMDAGVLSNPPEHDDIVQKIRQLSNRCARCDGRNPCTDNTYNNDSNAMISDVIGSKKSNFLAYSEVIGQVLYTEPGVQVDSVIAPPLGGAGYLPMYTDALVANRNTYEAKKEDIKKFMKFYTSVLFRHQYALCGDMPGPNCARYVLPANLGFYSLVPSHPFYAMLYEVITKSGTPGPNHELYYKKDCLDGILSKALKY
eukprot:Em0004g1717a